MAGKGVSKLVKFAKNEKLNERQRLLYYICHAKSQPCCIPLERSISDAL